MDSKDRTIEELRALVADLTIPLEKQSARITALELELAQAKKDSTTSSQPPSSDITKPKPKKSSRKKTRKGGQPGHQRQLRQPLPPDRVDEIIEYEIDEGEVIRLGNDETSIKNNGKKHWNWCITATTFSVFQIATTRSRQVLEKLVGPEFAGYLNFDYFSANCSFACERFRFASDVEPTNNHSEQQIRHCVIDRKITPGTRSETGQRYHERMWTAIATCKKLDRNFFSFLYDSIAAPLNDQPSPRLLNA